MRNTDKILEQLHHGVAVTLLERVESGEATPAELSAAIKFLKDNGIDAVPKEGSPLVNLAKVLPFQDPNGPLASEDVA